jgi:hypothetical protein
MKSFFEKIKKSWSSSKVDRIEIFARSCIHSKVSEKKKRHPFFSKLGCYQNLLHTIQNEKKVNLTFFLDTFYEGPAHFLQKQSKHNVVEIKKGTEAASFLFMLDYVCNLSLSDDTIIYFLEDDYLHRPGWVKVLREGINLGASDYITLYDHQDKYFLPPYKDLASKIYRTESSHWRTTPSTTNTYAMRFSTLKKHKEIHARFSEGVSISKDHDKFLHLNELGSSLLSPIPGWSTHMEPQFESPCVDWSKVLSQTTPNYENEGD